MYIGVWKFKNCEKLLNYIIGGRKIEIIEKIITPVCTLFGVIVGAIIPILLDRCREKRKMRKELRLQVGKISLYFKSLTLVFNTVATILYRDFDKEDDEIIYDLHRTLFVNIESIYSILPEIEKVLYVYFSKLIKHKLYESYVRSILAIKSVNYQNMTGVFDPCVEIKRNILKSMQKDKNLFNDANRFIHEFEKEFMVQIRG